MLKKNKDKKKNNKVEEKKNEELNAELAAELADQLLDEQGDEKESGENAENELNFELEDSVDPIVELEEKVAELTDQNLRLRADFDNYRKRVIKDIAGARHHAQLDAIGPFLTVFDHFSMAMMASEQSDNIDSLKQGLNMILNEFSKAFDDLGVTKLEAVGEKFNPELHDAVSRENSVEDEGTVIRQWAAGYKLGDRLVRPARVVVSSGPETESTEEESKA